MWIDRMRGMPWEAIQRRAKECSEIIAHKGDNILFKSKKKGETADAFNRLAEGIACLSFCPGGVKIFGEHWESCLDSDVEQRSGKTLIDLCSAIQRVLQENLQ